MSLIHYGVPYVPVTPASRPEPVHLDHEWVGWDGTRWNLAGQGPASGVHLRAGVRGLTVPPRQHYVRQSPAIAGQRFNGYHTSAREVFWPLSVHEPSEQWYEYDAAWWATMHPALPGTWRVTNPVAGLTRELVCRFLDDGDHTMVRDPGAVGWEQYGVRLVADDPFWRGDWVIRQFDNAITSSNFFGTGAPAFNISSSSQIASARISNPGDEASHLLYLLHGPFDSATAGIGDPGAITEYLAPVLEGRSVVIDTRPSMPATARLIDTPTAAPGSDDWETQVFDVPTESAFAGTGALALNSPLQPGEDRPLTITMVGAGAVTVAHRPPYWRAW